MRTNFDVGETEDDALIDTGSIEIGTDHHRRTELIQTEIFVESREIALGENGQFDGEIRRTRLKTGVHRCCRDSYVELKTLMQVRRLSLRCMCTLNDDVAGEETHFRPNLNRCSV